MVGEIMTVDETIDAALRKIGLRNVTATQLTEGMTALNKMLSAWEELLHYPTEDTHTLVSGTGSYSIGSGGDIDTTRPISLVSAFIRDSSNNDHNVSVNMSKKEYDDIYDKDASERPDKIYYLATYPLAYIYFNSAPSSAETLYLYSIKPYTAYSALDDNITQPPEWENAIIYNLALELAPEYNITPNAIVPELATIYLTNIGMRNASPIPEGTIDIAIRR